MREAPESESSHRHKHRKERVLHTRVSDNLAEDIRRIADDLRVPASNLVRNVLEEVFDVVESVTDDVGGLFGDVLEEADAARERLTRSRRNSRGRRGARSDIDEELAAAERRSGGPPPPPIVWHIVQEGSARGPLTRRELVEEARAGGFVHDTLVWCPGMPDWKPAGEVAGAAELVGPPPVPPKPQTRT